MSLTLLIDTIITNYNKNKIQLAFIELQSHKIIV